MTDAHHPGRLPRDHIDGKDQDLGTYVGEVVLVVNTASQCGLTPQYEGLQQLYDTYADQRPRRARLPVRPVRPPGAGHRGGDRAVLRAQLRRHVPDVRQDRRQRRGRPPALRVAEGREARPARRRDQVELHQVPGRPRRAACSTATRPQTEPAELVADIEKALAAEELTGLSRRSRWRRARRRRCRRALRSWAGTISVSMSIRGRNSSAFLLTPPPTTNRSGENSFSSVR